MNILGISCYYHDAAACLLRDGAVVAAAQEERFTRRRHDAEFPHHAIRSCLGEGGIAVADLDWVGFYDKPILKFERMLTTYLATFPRSFRSFQKAMPVWLRQKLWVKDQIRRDLGYRGEVLFAEHHQSHAASAFLVSPFREAAFLTVDGVGEWATASYGIGRDRTIEILGEQRFPHSLGLLYSAFTYYLGFKVNSAEYKVMGLAPYGEPRFAPAILDELVGLQEDGSFRMNMKYFDYAHGLTMTNGRFDRLFGGPPRDPEGPLEQRHKDLAASVQQVCETIMLRMARHVHRATGQKALCLAGGVALNCVANGRILREGPFQDLFIQPAAGDAGGAVGVAAYIHHTLLGRPRTWSWTDAYLGPAFGNDAIRSFLKPTGQPFHEHATAELLPLTARLLDEQMVVGWFQGRMEFGPRALGNRSILADARNPANKDVVNLKIKFRESFRPFAPAVLLERAAEYFDLDRPSPYMLLTAQVRPDRRVVPAITHVDGSARIQTVARRDNPLFYDLLAEFDRRTGCPVLINTSFNVRGEPIVCTPQDAYRCFMRTDMDALVMGNFLLLKRDMQPLQEADDWRETHPLD